MEHEHTEHVAAPPNRVFALLADVANLPRYVPQLTTAENLEGDKVRVEARYEGHTQTGEAWFRTDHTVFPYGAQFAVVRVDRDTGHVTIERLLIAYEVGRAVNPLMLAAQLVGGSIQGVGGALLEEFTYDRNGEPLAVTFADYLMPTLRDAPPVDVLIAEDFPSPRNPLGLKGAGEGGINAVGAVIAGAIDDAIGVPGAVTRLPVTPQRLRAILRNRSRIDTATAGQTRKS